MWPKAGLRPDPIPGPAQPQVTKHSGGRVHDLDISHRVSHHDSMRTYSVHEAKTHLSRLLRRAEAGEDVVITRSGLPVARLSPVHGSRRVFGQDRGRLHVPDDFDAPLDDDLLRAFEGSE